MFNYVMLQRSMQIAVKFALQAFLLRVDENSFVKASSA